MSRHDSNGTLDSLHNAIIVYRHALDLYSEDERHMLSMSCLAYALGLCFQRTGSMTDLEEAVLIDRELLFLRPPSHSDYALSLNNLSIGLMDRFRTTGSMTDLEQAILMQREPLS